MSTRSQSARASDLSRGFPPVIAKDAVVLVLGSLPSEASIAAGQYYAHPRNAFWKIMSELCGGKAGDSYRQRLAALTSARVALWDVLAAAGRPGSLDSSIVTATAEVNDFGGLFDQCPSITAVFFNGKKAYELYERRVLDGLASNWAALSRQQLPSTSPAHASLRFEEKLEHWRRAIAPYLLV